MPGMDQVIRLYMKAAVADTPGMVLQNHWYRLVVGKENQMVLQLNTLRHTESFLNQSFRNCFHRKNMSCLR